MVRLSIIIPFYNVEQYIAQCLDSVFQQDIPEEEYEVICVNDASPDGSREIVKEYQKKHKNLVLVEHEKNKKLGAARNTGRKAARGKYIWNVDSDDRIAPNCLRSILDNCESFNVDVLQFGYKQMHDGVLKTECGYAFKETSGVVRGVDFFRNHTKDQLSLLSPVWRMVIRKDFLDINKIYSPEINMSEDVPYTYRVILTAERLRIIEAHYYYQSCNLSSIGLTMRKAPSAISAYESCFIATRDTLSLVDKYKDEGKQVTEKILPVGLYCYSLYSDYYSRMNEKEQKTFLSLCRRNFCRNAYIFKYLSWSARRRYIVFVVTGRIIK